MTAPARINPARMPDPVDMVVAAAVACIRDGARQIVPHDRTRAAIVALRAAIELVPEAERPVLRALLAYRQSWHDDPDEMDEIADEITGWAEGSHGPRQGARHLRDPLNRDTGE